MSYFVFQFFPSASLQTHTQMALQYSRLTKKNAEMKFSNNNNENDDDDENIRRVDGKSTH